MAYTWEEIKFLGKEWWGEVPFKEKIRGFFPIAVSMVGPALNTAVPILTVAALKAARLAGIEGIRALSWTFFWNHALLAVGWILGWALADLDHIFYALTCDPREETCQRVRREIGLKRWSGAWRILSSTANEREKLPIRNAVTLFVVGAMGLWISTSTVSVLALGVVLGLGIRILIDMGKSKKYQQWYWLFKREFSAGEHRAITIIMALMYLYQGIGVLRI